MFFSYDKINNSFIAASNFYSQIISNPVKINMFIYTMTSINFGVYTHSNNVGLYEYTI